MSRFAIFVTLTIKPGSFDVWKAAALENATAAVRDEPECHRFEVITPEEGGETVHYFEVYTDAAALEAHREYPHFKKYVEATADLTLSRNIQRLTVLNPAD